jgi:hypothetical protein
MSGAPRWLASVIILCFVAAGIWWRAAGQGLRVGLIIVAAGAAITVAIIIAARIAK